MQIGYDVVISAPHIHAHCLEQLAPKLIPGAKVLDVGCGSGYLCAAMYELTKSKDGTAKIFGIEHIPQLAQ
jgi:protein-L-isoaspartate(D-aspartate) O-methyltransferase